MRSTTLFVWVAVALTVCAWMFPVTDALAQFQFDGTQIICVNDPANNDGIINTIGDSLELQITIGGLDLYRDAVEVVFNPVSGLGIIPTLPQTYSCPTGVFSGHRMQTIVVSDSGVATAHPDSMKIRARYRFRPEGLCALNPQANYQVWARAVRSSTHDTLCGNSPTFQRAVPCSVCTGCGYIRIDELCGFVDGIIAIGDRVFLDTAAVQALEAALPPPTGGARDCVYVNFNRLTCATIDDMRDTVFVVGDIVNVVECIRENGFCGDSFQVRVGYWTGSWPPTEFDSTKRLTLCVRPVDNVRPQLQVGMVDSFRILNGNTIRNDSLAGCCDTLRIFMATDPSYIGAAYPFFGDLDGASYTDFCGVSRVRNFDMSWIGLWFGDLMGESRQNDTSGYKYNSVERGLLCPQDTFLWMSNRFGTTYNPGTANNLMWIDVPLCPDEWDSLQICLLEAMLASEDTLFMWGFDDAGNASNWVPWADTAICIDVVPPTAELGSDIYHADGYCIKRFSPYDSVDAHQYINLSPDSMEWIKGRVDTMYDASDLLSVFNDVYMIGFDVRVMPEDQGPITRLNYLHPMAPLPMDVTLDTMRWNWVTPYVDPNDTLQDAIFAWYGKQGTDSIDPVLGTGDVFWRCNQGGGLTVGITFARWLDAAGCNRVLGSDYDGSTNISENYTTRNQLHAVLDMCPPTTVLPGDTLICTNLPYNSGGYYNVLPGPAQKATYLWVGPNNGSNPDPVLRFRPRRIFAEDTTFDICQVEDTLFYRIRVDTVDLIYALGAWPGVNDSVRWYSGSNSANRTRGTGAPHGIWTPITFNAGDVNGPEISFTWGHKYGAGANDYLPDGLYKLTLELKDDAGNVYIDPIYMWLNGWGPNIDSLVVCNIDTQCTFNFYTGDIQDTLAIWLQTDTTAEQVLIDWTCVHNISAHPDRDTTFAQLVSSSNTFKKWFGYLIITPDMVADEDTLNVYEVAPYEPDCEKGAGGLRIINVRPLDIAGSDTIYSEADPTHDCDKAAIGLTPCPRIITEGDYPLYDGLFWFVDPDTFDVYPPSTFLYFGDNYDEFHAISPGKIDSMGGSGTYNAITNWANDQVQDSIYLMLLIDSSTVRADTLDTLIVQFINYNYNPPRIREVRKGLFRPTSVDLVPDVNIKNTVFHGFLERYFDNPAMIEFRYFWNGTWFLNAGVDSHMLVPYNQHDTITVKAFVQAVDSLIDLGGGNYDTVYNVCPDTLYALLDVDNVNPFFRNNWTGWNNPGHEPNTGTTRTVKNLGWDADGDGNPEDCGFRFSDGEHFRLKVKLSEKVHEFPLQPPYFPNTDGSHHDGSGFWPLTRNWQISPIDLRTGDLFAFGSNPGDSCVVVLDSVIMDSVNLDSVYYTIYGYFDFPAAAVTYFASNPGPVDSVAMVIRAAWDEAGNPGRYNNPVFNDGLKNDACEDTTFWVTLTSPSPWTGCPLAYGQSQSSMLQGNAAVGFVMDYSGSMGSNIVAMQNAALAFVSNMRAGDRGAVVKFDDEVDITQPFTDDLGLVQTAISTPFGGGTTALWNAVVTASNLIQPEVLTKALIVLTDGQNNVGPNTVTTAVAAALAAGTRVYTIGLGGSVDVGALTSLATQTGGQYYSAPSGAELEAIYLAIAGEIIVSGAPVMGWIAAEEDSVVIKAIIIETSEIAICPESGGPADSIHVLEGNFQTITDDPNPWVVWDERGPWILYIDGDDTLGWAREYTWFLRADSSDLATIHCDGDYLPFTLRFNTYGIPWPMFTHTFNNCLQVDVNEPKWAQHVYADSLGHALTSCFDPRQPVTMIAQISDAYGDVASCGYSPGVGVLRDFIWGDFSDVLQNAAMDSVVPDSVVGDAAYWTFTPAVIFSCVDSASAIIKLHALHDSVNHHDRELVFLDTLWFCSDCVPPHIQAVNVFCECDTALDFAVSPDSCNADLELPIHHIAPGSAVNLVLCIADANGDSSVGIDPSSVYADFSWINSSYGWVAADSFVGTGSLVKFLFGFDCLPEDGGSMYVVEDMFDNGEMIRMAFRFCDNFGNCDTDTVSIAIADTLPPIVDFVYTIGDDSIRAYVTPGDEHVHIYADLTGYAADLVSHPEHVWADMSRFWCDSTDRANHDTVYANYVEQTGPNSFRAYWGWYPGTWLTDPSQYPIPFDTLSLLSDTHRVAALWDTCHSPSIEGWHDTLWFYVTDAACNLGSAFSVFEVSGIDSTVPAVDRVEIYGNGCREGWISSTPMDSGHIEVWAYMDSIIFNELRDTLLIDSMQANLAQLGSDYAWTQWSSDLKGGAPVYGTLPNDPEIVQTMWEMVGNRLVAKWIFLTARDLGCEDSVVVGVKAIRSTGTPVSHGYYTDVEYGVAYVDTTRPVIYDMRVHSSTTSINETTWVSPNVPIYVDVWVYDTNCDTVRDDHLGFDLNDILGPAPFITFCNDAGFDTIWTWDTTAYSILHQNLDSLHRAWIVLRWIGTPNFDDTCNAIDLNDITGCIEAHIEDCLSNPAVPEHRNVTTDDVPPLYVMSNSWGDYTIVTGFPGDPDHIGIDSVLVLQRGVYDLDYDSLLTVYVIVDNKWNGDAPGDTLISWAGTYINFDPWGPATFLTTPIQHPDEIYYNIDGLHRDSIVWKIPLYSGGPLFNVNVPSNRYWFQLVLRDTMGNVTGDSLDPEDPLYHPFTLFCDDLDSAISFTIQNANRPNPGMILLCDSTTVAGSDSDFVDAHNMNLWNNEFFSPDTLMENLYKIYYAPGEWAWYSHEDDNQTRFFIFVEDTVLQSDGIDNDADGDVDEVGEGVDFYTADLRINGWGGPQVGHVDSMNVEGHWINYLWFADNFDQQRYDIYLRISDIYGHIDTLACGDYALQFFEDESCPFGDELFFYHSTEGSRQVRVNDTFLSSVNLPDLNADDHMYVFSSFDSISLVITDPRFLIANQNGSGPDLDTTTVDSINYNDGLASMIELLDPEDNPVVGFVQRYMHDYEVFNSGALMLVDPTGGNALADKPDGLYTIRVTLLDRVGNSCVRTWPFILDRTCPAINTELTFTTRPGQNTPTDDLYTSWDYVEIIANVTDALDGVDSIHYEYCFDANRDGTLDAYPYWQTINILSDEGGAWDTEYPFVVYWNIRNLPWNSEDTLGLPPVNPDTCMNRYFVRVRAEDIYGHECEYVFPVDITDDIAPLAYIERIGRPGWGWDLTPQGAVVPCYNPNTGLADSMIYVYAYDYIDTTHWGYDPMPGDTFTWYNHWFDLAKGLFQYKVFDAPNVNGAGDPYAGWVNMWTPGEDTATYRNWFNEKFIIQWNLKHPLTHEPLRSDQYNIRFVGIDVCGNADPLNTPVITVRLECDTTAPIAVICYPPADSRLTNWRCDPEAEHDGWVQIRTASGIWADIDSVAFYFVDSLSVPGMGITTFIGGDGDPVVVQDSFNTEATVYWNTNNLLSGWYWLYAVAYDNDDNFDTDPIWQRVYVDNTAPVMDSCMASVTTINDGQGYFYLYAYPSDPDGGIISGVLFQYLNRQGNWMNLPNDETVYDVPDLYGANIDAGDNPDIYPYSDGGYSILVNIWDFEQSPLDSIRFRAIAIDEVDIGSNNWQGDRNRDCHVDRDLVCGGDNDGDGILDLCCMAVEIRDEIPDSTCIWLFNHGSFTTCCLPNLDTRYAVGDGAQFSTCNYQNPLDTLLLVAKVHSGVEDGWLMHFKFWRSYPEGSETTPIYVPNNTALNPWVQIPASGGPIVLYHSWDSVYVIWTGARAYLDSADAADGLWLSEWTFAAYTEDLTGNVEVDDDCNTTNIVLACLPNAPITHVSYVQNDVENPENRVRVTNPVIYNDLERDTIEVIYNRTTGPGVNDPEALVIFYTDASTIRNCRNDLFEPFNIRLYELYNHNNQTLGRICPSSMIEPFGYAYDSLGWDQYPPDGESDRYAVGLYLDNSYGPGVYNFAMIVRLNEIYMPFESKIFWEGDSDLDDDFDAQDSTRIDLVVRVVNVNEPQMSICYPTYGDMCVSGTVPMSASLLPNPEFTGTIDTVWFQYYDGTDWQPVVDEVYGVSYDTDPGQGYVRFEFDEHMVPDMAGWYYQISGNNVGDPTLSWYAERDLFPDVWVWVDSYSPRQMYRDENGLWTTNVWISGTGCRNYGFIIDANDNNLVDPDGIDRWVRDPKDPCGTMVDTVQSHVIPVSQVCLCDYWINFPSRDFANRSYNFRTVVGWHDPVAYHVIENPSLGDTIHVFFVDNEPAEATHDIEFDATVLSGGMFNGTPGGAGEICNPADTVWFVTDVQPLGTHNLVVEDICMVVYQVSLTSQPQVDHSWMSVDSVLSTQTDWGWADAWSGFWKAVNPLSDNVDNDGDGLVDETHDVQAGNGIGEENVKFWTRSIVYDQCGNIYYSNEDTIWVDVSEPQACITQVGDVSPADNQIVIVPPMAEDSSRVLLIQAQDMSYADQGVIAIFQYRKLNSGLPWKNIQPYEEGGDTVRHEDHLYNAYWDLTKYFAQCTHPDPEGWYQLRAIAIDTVGNSDACDHVICQITIRLNDIEPASRIEVYQIWDNRNSSSVSCTDGDIYYIQPYPPYKIKAIFAGTNIDTGMASLTFQYQSLTPGGDPSEWRNIETIWDNLDYGLNGDTTDWVIFQPRPQDIGQHGFNIRVIVEDYNGNDTSAVVALYADNTPPEGTGEAGPSVAVTGPCGDRCRLDITEGNALVSATFLPDAISGEVNVASAWLQVRRDDNLFFHDFAYLTRLDEDTWTFDFNGNLCQAWATAHLDMGCYYFWVHFTDCIGNTDSMAVMTTCGEDRLTTDLICIDCDPDLPELSTLDYMTYYSSDCVTGQYESPITDNLLDGTTEIGGDQTVKICGILPDYQQYIREVWLYVESEEAGVSEAVVDDYEWGDSRASIDSAYCFFWELGAVDGDGHLLYPSGRYHVWVRAVDAICQIQSAEPVDEFWVDVDHGEPDAWITQILDVVPNPSAPDTFDVNSFFGSGTMGGFWVEWADGLTPDDSTQAHNRVQMWAKNQLHPNQADAWQRVDSIPSPCNPHFVLWGGAFVCGETFDLVAIVQDRWGNGDLDVERVMEAYTEGRWVDIYLMDQQPPVTQLWSIGLNSNPANESNQVVVDQQNHIVHLSSNYWDQDVYLNVFASGADENIERVHFQYSLDGEIWFDIATDDQSSAAPNCTTMTLPLPWWCEFTGRHIMWNALWDISGLRGHVWVRHWAQDLCGNTEGYNVTEVTIDVQAPMAKVYAWLSNVNVNNLPCPQWTEPQIPDTLERYATLTLGACPDSTGTVHYDANKAYWYIKRADASPIDDGVWCYLGRDDDAPFSESPVRLWNREEDCLEPQVGAYYDIAVRMSDNNDHTVPWVQFLYNGAGVTAEEQWQDLISRGYVKRIKIVDHIAPVAHTIEVDTDCTPDSSVIFLHGNVHLTSMCDDPDVFRVTFAARELGATGPWTIIDIVEGDSGTSFRPSGCSWNTELMNGTYIIGAFAEDYYGNRDGDPNVANRWPSHTLTVNIDNQPPTAAINSVLYNGLPVTSLERGATHTFRLSASDNFGLRSVALYFRHSGGDPDNWHLIASDINWPFSFNWLVPETLVVGWTYDFAAVATDLCNWTDMVDGQGHYVVDGTYPIVDNETYLAIYTIGGQDAETTPRVNGTNVCLVAHSEPRLDNVRFLFVRGGDTTLIGTDVDTIGTTVWSLCGWDVTTLAEGPAQLCAVGSADLGGHLVTRAVDCRNIVIDHSLPYAVAGNLPVSRGLVGGLACMERLETQTWADDIWIQFVTNLTDPNIDTVWFEYKMAADPNEPSYWHGIGEATLDQGLTGRWAYSWYSSLTCGLITLRARVSDNAVPLSNEALIIFADSVRVDNMSPNVEITNINGDVTPVGTEIGWGQVATIVATIMDPFCNGGNSSIDSAAFFVSEHWQGFGRESEVDSQDVEWEFIGGDNNGAPWQAMWNTSTVEPGEYLLKVIGWDEAGNCAIYTCNVNIVDQLHQRAWIIGFDADNDPGCDDAIWVVTDDCPPNYTSRVRLEYTTNNGTTWISLGEEEWANSYCDAALDYNMWEFEFEFDNVPTGAIFRAVAIDESNNVDPNPPRFQFSDVTSSAEAVIFHEDFVRVHVTGGQVPWVSALLEQAPPNENCFTDRGLVCVNPVEGDPTGYAGILPDETLPCNLDNRDGKITVYTAVPVTRGDNTYMTLVKYEMNIHQVDPQTGSNGWLTSEDQQLQMYIPVDGVEGFGTAWFQPAADFETINMLPPWQYYYTILSDVEYVLTENISTGQHESRFKMRFDPTLLPEGAQDWNVVATYYDRASDMWTEYGIIYQTRNLNTGLIEFYFPCCVNWNASNEVIPADSDTVTVICPNKLAFAVMFTTVRPIDEWVRFANQYCEWEPDSTYYTPERGPTVGCDVTWWAVLRQGEYIPPENTIDVYLDGIRIINDGRPDAANGYTSGPIGEGQAGEPLFTTSYNPVSGVYSVRFTYAADYLPPWYASGCLRNGQHTIQFYTNNLHTHLTPFWVDRTEPEAWTYPEYINHQVNLWANLTDAETGIDTNSVYCIISDCTPSAFTIRAVLTIDTIAVRLYNTEVVDSLGAFLDSTIFVMDSIIIGFEVIINEPTRAFILGSEAMTFSPIDAGYRAGVTMQWEQLHQWLIANNNAGTMCVTWQFRNKICEWNDSTTYVYTIDVEPPMVWPVSPVGAAIDDDGDGIANEDWRDCMNNDNDWWWNAEFAHWQERIDEDPVNFEADTFMYGIRPTIQAVMNDLNMCGSGASGVNVNGIWLNVDGQIFTIADTANPNLNFHVLWPYNQTDDAYLQFGGTDNEALAAFYAPGPHRITCAAPDSAGNVGSYQFSWTYYVRSPGPAVVHDTTTRPCGVWFDPEISNVFTFDVYATNGAEIAANGAQFTVYRLPSGERIHGPEPLHILDPLHAHGDYNLSGSFPDGQSGIEVVVEAWNIHFDPRVDSLNGFTRSRITYWADNLPPTFTNHLPEEGAIFNRDQAITIEVFYSDDSPAGSGAIASSASQSKSSGMDISKKAEVRISRTDADGKNTILSKNTIAVPTGSRDRGTLDDNGSGINVSSFRMSIVKPNGDVIVPTTEQFIELDRAHAKYVMAPVHIPGMYTVNVRVEDCVGNVGADAFNFHVASAAPAITFTPVEGECQYDGYWNPDHPLRLRAQLREMDGVNTKLENIRVAIVRFYNCATGTCVDTLTPAEFTCNPLPDDEATDQIFTITGDYNLSTSVDLTEVRIVITATNALGATVVRVQPWIVDATAPWITIVSPLPNSVVPESMPVTINVNFGDTQDGLVAMTSSRRNGEAVPTIKIGPQRVTESKAAKTSTNDSKSKLGPWANAVATSLDDLDGNSGVDVGCVDLILFPHSGGEPVNLTEASIIRPNNIVWIGNLEAGSYTVILSICDRVCNTASTNWSFVVAPDNAGVSYDPPYYVSSMPHTFIMHTYGENIDHASMNLAIEGAVMIETDTSAYQLWVPVIEDAAVQWQGDSVWYTANFDLAAYVQLRLTLRMNFTYGIPVPTGSQVYVVDIGAPRIVSVTPDPEVVLAAGSMPTFQVDFVEVGNTTLEPTSIRVWLDNASTSQVVAGTFTSSVDGAGRSGYGRLVVSSALAFGHYRLYAEVADIAGNRATANWTYEVGYTADSPARLLDSLTSHNYPNPFEAGQETRFSLPVSMGTGAYASIKIYDFSGMYVATVYDGYLTGSEITWAGRNDDGEMIANGVYLARCVIRADGKTKEDVVKVAFKNKK